MTTIDRALRQLRSMCDPDKPGDTFSPDDFDDGEDPSDPAPAPDLFNPDNFEDDWGEGDPDDPDNPDADDDVDVDDDDDRGGGCPNRRSVGGCEDRCPAWACAYDGDDPVSRTDQRR